MFFCNKQTKGTAKGQLKGNGEQSAEEWPGRTSQRARLIGEEASIVKEPTIVKGGDRGFIACASRLLQV